MVDRTLPNDVDAPGTPALVRASILYLVLEGQRPLAGGARIDLTGVSSIRIGRGSERAFARADGCIRCTVPDAQMSSDHAEIVREGASFSLVDRGSRNGSLVRGARVTRETLRDGDRIELGTTLFVFRESVLTTSEFRELAELSGATDAASAMATLLPSYAQTLTAFTRIAASNVSVLLSGETGSGKEVAARALHAASGRKGAFVPVNCGALTASLLESQLFGHTKGAFSGATKDELGFVRASDGGTLFLDEIGDMPLASQVALLRVLQERSVVPVGATRAVDVDLRVVAATHRPLPTLASEGAFRADLYARLAGYTHRLLPLRERIEDLGVLMATILSRLPPAHSSVRFTSAAVRVLANYTYPLNTRELEQALSVSVLLAPEGIIDAVHLPESMKAPSSLPQGPLRSEHVDRSNTESPEAELSEDDERLRASLLAALAEHRGNVSHVASALGRTRMQIHRWLRRWNIDVASYRR